MKDRTSELEAYLVSRAQEITAQGKGDGAPKTVIMEHSSHSTRGERVRVKAIKGEVQQVGIVHS